MRKAYILLAWIFIPLALLAWLFIPQARQALIQFLWSYYLLWQFWFLARSKTMTWTGTARFFVVGAWLIAPLSAGIIFFFHLLFAEGASSLQADWSSEILGPIVEETVKLLPFFFLFLFTRRTRTFSLTDYLLAGAAVGVGFDFMEEMLRRWVVADIDGGLLGLLVNLLHNTKQNWSLFTLFPGSFESGEAISPGYGIWTGFVTLAIGLGVRYRQRWGNKVFLLPLFIFAWAAFDHGAWNAHYGGMPLLAELLYLLTGQGHFFKWLFVFAFLLAIILDYRQLNRVRGSLPLLPGERLLEPVMELFTLLQSFFRGRQAWGHMLLFTRERRQLGFSVLKPLGEETQKEEKSLREKLQQRFLLLGSLLALFFLIGTTAATFPLESMDAYFTGLFDRLADWWQGLNGWEKAGVITAVTVLGGLLMVATGGGILAGGFTALSIALTAQDLLENRAQTKAFLEDPVGTLKQWGKELLQRPPQEAAILLLSVVITRRLPVFRALDELVSGAKESLQRFAKKGATKKKVSTGTGSSPDGSQSTGEGGGKEPEKIKKKVSKEKDSLQGDKHSGSKINSDHPIRTYRQLDFESIDEVLRMDTRLIVEMPFEGRGKSNVNAEGWLRSADFYWDEIVKRYPEAFSQRNLDILGGKYEFRTPLNDKQFRSIFTQYDVRGLRGHPLIHHHIGGGGQAAAVPKPLHNGFGGIHNAEKKAGIWGRDKPYSDMLQRMLESLEEGSKK